MADQTDVTAGRPGAPGADDERLAAFRRGAPTPAAPATDQASPRTRAPRAGESPAGEPSGGRLPAPADPSGSTPKPRRKPASKTRPKPKAADDERSTMVGDVPEGDASPVAATDETEERTGATPRRRRRGGRGRGGASRPATTEAREAPEPAEAGNAVGPDSVAVEDADAQRDDALPDTTVEQTGGAGDSSDGPPRRRRRRGSRGKGVSSSETAAPEPSTADPPGKGSTRSRSTGKGSKAKTPATKKPAKPAATSKGSQRSVEERVAAGGPTRGVRSTRSRTGRGGRVSRRRREPTIVPPRVTDKLMVITEHGERDQIAVLEEDVLVQHYVTRTGAHSMVGNVYLGRVQNVLPGMEAAFVDISRGRNGVLYAGEVNYSPEDLEGEAPRIEHVLKPGQAVMVQVTKDPMGGKGARLTAQISLPGRFLVLAPDQDVSGISRRLPDDDRKRLKAVLNAVKPKEHGVIVRTAAEGASEDAITHDLTRLIAQWSDIQKRAKKVKAPNVLYEEPELTVRVVRDLFTDEEFRGLVTDSARVHEKVMDYVRDVAPDLEPKIALHQGKLAAFEEYRIEEQIHKALDRKVWLPSGGYLIVERTEAMAIIDVNTGKSVGKTNLEETVVNTNLEAAREVARQLRLRDIGGIIVVDFIDMLLDKNKQQVEDTMKEALAVDKTRSQVFEIGPLGLMQVTRKRVSGGLVESFSETCPTCEGRGILINYEV
jgi:ribonuclease E